MRGAAHRLRGVGVRRVEANAGPLEAGMHDLAPHRFGRRRAVGAVALHRGDLAQAAPGVEGERLLAGDGEEEIVGQLHESTLRLATDLPGGAQRSAGGIAGAVAWRCTASRWAI